LNAPRPGLNVKYNSDPQIRLQKIGANLMANVVGIEYDRIGEERVEYERIEWERIEWSMRGKNRRE
jgi:hypothetical protein